MVEPPWKIIEELSPKNPRALRLIANITTNYNLTVTNATIRLYNWQPRFLTQYEDFIGYKMRLTVGMDSALGLARPEQKGIVAIGTIEQHIVENVGTDSILLFKLFYTEEDRLNGPFEVQTSGNIGNAIKSYLRRNQIENVRIAPDVFTIVPAESLKTQPVNVSDLNASLLSTYDVRSTQRQGSLYYFTDNSAPVNTVLINPENGMIGQPRATGPAEVYFQTLARGNVQVGDHIESNFRFGSLTQAFGNQPRGIARGNISFTGLFRVVGVKHNLDSRSSSFENWATNIQTFRLNP